MVQRSVVNVLSHAHNILDQGKFGRETALRDAFETKLKTQEYKSK